MSKLTTMTLALTADEIAAVEKLYTPSFLHMLHALRSDEGDSVTLLADNGDGPPNNAIECCGDWTGWEDRRFTGETLTAAVQAAFLAKLEAGRAAISNQKDKSHDA